MPVGDMTLRQLFFSTAVCSLGFLASCSSNSNPDNFEEATQIADGTLPPWMIEATDGDAKGYTAVANNNSDYKPYTAGSGKKTASKSSSTKNSTAKTSSSRKKSSASSSKKSSSSRTSTYIVKKGDTVERIARRNGTTTKKLMSANGMKSDFLSVGKKLVIPKK